MKFSDAIMTNNKFVNDITKNQPDHILRQIIKRAHLKVVKLPQILGMFTMTFGLNEQQTFATDQRPIRHVTEQ